MNETKQGFHRQSLFEYIEGPGVSRSYLHELLRSAGHGKYKKEHPKTTKALRVGDATHAAILEPDRFKSQYIILPPSCKPGTKDNPNKGMAANKEAFLIQCEADGKSVIQPDDDQNLREMAGVVQSDQYAIDLLSEGEAEVCVYYTDPDYGILVKVRLDWYKAKTGEITDLKTCADARHFPFRASAFSHGYDLQAFMSLYVTTQVTGKPHEIFNFIAIESEGYHGLNIWEADKELLDTGFKKYTKAMVLYKECLESGEYPGYDSTPQPLGSPSYAKERLGEVYYD